jgi:hypothetical protein
MTSAVEQQVAADEAGASDGASQLNLVLGRLTEMAEAIVPTSPTNAGKRRRLCTRLSLPVALASSGVSRHLQQKARCRATPAALPRAGALQQFASAAGGSEE